MNRRKAENEAFFPNDVNSDRVCRKTTLLVSLMSTLSIYLLSCQKLHKNSIASVFLLIRSNSQVRLCADRSLVLIVHALKFNI